jgi:hypothetical protein
MKSGQRQRSLDFVQTRSSTAIHLLVIHPIAEQPVSGALIADLQIEIVGHAGHSNLTDRIDLPCRHGALSGQGFGSQMRIGSFLAGALRDVLP